jgi:hypothetical protein
VCDAWRATLIVPERFYTDHVGRGLPAGEAIGRVSSGIVVEFDRAGFADLLDDARFYVEMGVSEFGPDLLGLISSARATVRKLESFMESGGGL